MSRGEASTRGGLPAMQTVARVLHTLFPHVQSYSRCGGEPWGDVQTTLRIAWNGVGDWLC